MATKRTNVGWPDLHLYKLVEREATRSGCSVAEFMRNAAIARAVVNYVRRTPGHGKAFEDICNAASADPEGMSAAAERLIRDADPFSKP